ncbi:EF-hand calcium-binding domain-containing protein 12 [Perognathus longimembris pacificus]|uniref:EF-hand calcium-binding domain-containing protein 12 n=1 Tax=Perognathus longimembris pacificus TaxID=214514 RepID=UPI00201A1FD8|nr:EF-hand calcium-binding domain-containing protein 12 [Perognathus longimembris pacificus]
MQVSARLPGLQAWPFRFAAEQAYQPPKKPQTYQQFILTHRTHSSYLALFPQGFCQPDPSDDEDSVRSPTFRPELVIAHCFQQFTRKDFRLPRSRRRIIVLPPQRGQEPRGPGARPPAPPQPLPSYNASEPEALQEQPLDRETWLSQRLRLRKQLESLGNVRRWLNNKADITPSESKILQDIQDQHGARAMRHPSVLRTAMKRPRAVRHPLPQLRLPKPGSLAVVYSFLCNHKIKIMDLFEQANRGEGQKISREEFIMTLKAIGIPLKNQELEDLFIYLSSLGKQNAITIDILNNTYKQWSTSQPRSFSPQGASYVQPKCKAPLKSSLKKPRTDSARGPPKMDLLQVPKIDTGPEFRPLTLEEMEDVGKRYRERRRRCKVPIPSIQYSECCRLVRCGKRPFDEHCLPSTVAGDMKELINQARRDAFLVYLECWKECEAYGIPLTEDVLMRALLYPGDKIVYQEEQVIPIRQPGGYYQDWLLFPLSLAVRRAQGLLKPAAKKIDKKTPKKMKKMDFKEFEDFAGKLKKSPRAAQHTHPNFFWPGHLLDKLRLYLPAVAGDGKLAIFSCVQEKRHAYPATYHPNRSWPLGDRNYVTYANYDTTKVYSIT